MILRKLALVSVFFTYAVPALAEDFSFERKRAPKPITSFELGTQSVEVLAVTRRARADTARRRAYHKECQAMSKALPGYPQPAFFSVDFRVYF